MNERVKELTNSFVDSVKSERKGELSKNGARLSKGYYLVELEREGIKLKGEGVDMPWTPLQAAIAAAEEALEHEGVFDTNLDNDEVSIVRKAYVKVAEPLGGVGATFSDYFATNPHTDAPLVNDAGQPFERPLTEIAVNKLYVISDWAEHDFDAALSFAKRATEKGLRSLHKLWRRTKDPNAIFNLINDLVDNNRVTEDSIRDQVNGVLGITDASPEYKSVSIPIDIYEGVWTRSREMMSLILGFCGFTEFLEKDSGRVYPGILLEAVYGTLLDPLEYGPWRMLETLTRSNLLTTEQAANFKLAWEQDGLNERWNEVMETGELPTWEQVTESEEAPL